MSKILISSLVQKQLPGFIREEYPIFVTFLEKYYEWLEQSGNVLDESSKILESQDVDLASNFYVEQIKKEFLPNFPEVSLLSDRKLIKFAREFYNTKGTPDSVKFLFRALFNEEVDIYYPKDDILRASDGKWVLPLALRIDTTDDNIFNIVNTTITGETSKATALVETVTRSIDRQLGISYIEVYISNVQRLFETGETLTATYNNGITDVTVSGKLIGSLSEIKIDPNNRGLFYRGYDPEQRYDGDPLTIVGGLNTESINPIGAQAFVGSTTQGAVTDIVVVDGGFGFRNPVDDGYETSLVDFKDGFTGALFGTEARAEISLVDSLTTRTMNVSDTQIETIFNETLDTVGNSGNSENTVISSISSYQSFNVFPISYISLTGSGGGYRTRPDVDIFSWYNESLNDILVIPITTAIQGTNYLADFSQDLRNSFEVGDYVRLFINQRYEEIKIITEVEENRIYFADSFQNTVENLSVFKVLRNDLYNLGSLGRIDIQDGGEDYQVGEYLIFTGGSGYGANARISEVHTSNNGIKSVEFLQTDDYVIGGEGYTRGNLPTITIDTTFGANAVLIPLEVSGNGEDLSLTTSRIGAISSIRIISYGYDYVSAPTISLRNADLLVSNVTEGKIFVSNTRVYQGTSNTITTFSAYVDKFDQDTNTLRIYDYTGTIGQDELIISDDGEVDASILSFSFYGDGKAKATASFENGLIRYPGLYLNTDGHLSQDKKLQDGVKYHNFSYVINTNQDYVTFKRTLDEVIHPIGTKTFVTKLYTHDKNIPSDISNVIYRDQVLDDTFNIAFSSNNMVSTNTSANLQSYVSVGDIVILQDLFLAIDGTFDTTENSNVITASSNSYIDYIQDGDTIHISTGNTEIVTSVESNNTIITQNVIGINSSSQTINVEFNDTKIVTFVNANTILVDTNFSTTNNNIVVIHRKVE